MIASLLVRKGGIVRGAVCDGADWRIFSFLCIAGWYFFSSINLA
jgi:hypothetical protein